MNGFDAAYSFGFYEGSLQKLVQLLKYGGIYTLAKPLGAMLASACPLTEPIDLVVPVPMHWLRRWKRGFNQAELLGNEVARRIGVNAGSAVRRKRRTPPQAGLSDSVRRRNVSGAFAVPKPSAVRGLHVLLVDDVLTTGATASACASALKRAGARRVSVLTLARVDRRIVPDSVRPTKTRSASNGGC